MLTVAICICTFRREELLRELLETLSRLRFSKVPTPHLRVVVVDNDPQASAQQISASVPLPWPTIYAVEPSRGITYARNRAIAEAGADFIAFIDDDETPSPYWLDELLWAQMEFKADVVSGPVLPKYAEAVPGWVKRGGFFDALKLTTGTVRHTCACNDVLIAAHVFTRVTGFDDAFALSGAEDTNFFLRVRNAGYTIIWCQEATVFEVVSAKRATIAWLLRREFQTGNGWIFCELGLNPNPRAWILRLGKAVAHVVTGTLGGAVRLLCIDSVGVVRSLQRMSLGIGMLVGLFGHRFLAYRATSPETQGAEQPLQIRT